MAKIISGTTLVKDIRPGTNSSSPSYLTEFNSTLYFSAEDENYNRSLWKSDGTEAGTVGVKSIYPVADSSWVSNLINVNGTLYFEGESYYESDYENAEYGTFGLWKSDGTQAGTIPLVEYTCDDGEYDCLSIHNQTSVNNNLFYIIEDYYDSYELWTSNGTVEGTKILQNHSWDYYPGKLTNFNGMLYFTVEGWYNTEWKGDLWKSDGTEEGTVLVYEALNYESDYLIDFKGVLYFTVDDNENGGLELWKSDGTTAGTLKVKDIYSGAGNNDHYITDFAKIGDTMFFMIQDKVNGASQLWKSNGKAAGTVKVKDLHSGEYYNGSYGFTDVNGTLFLLLEDYKENTDEYDYELWKSDGTAAGTVLLKEFEPSDYWDRPQNLINVNGTLYFTAWDPVYGYELWKSDGTQAGTVVAVDINPGAESSRISNIANINGTLYFSAYHKSYGYELWKSDGTSNKKYIGDAQDNSYRAGVGNDTLLGKSGNDTLYGDEGTDLIQGDNENDLLSGGLEKDTLAGGMGDDFLLGEGGSDRLNGNAGYDALSGGSGDDVILGGDDFDFLKGEKGNDSLKGDAGNDVIRGGLGLDNISGGTGNDTLMGDEGNDVIKGDGGQDLITGALPTGVKPGAGEIDTLTGGGAKDTFVLGNNNGAFYRTSGIKDYALIKDFSKTDSDRIQLAGTASDYKLANAKDYLNISGKAIVLTATDQLIGVIQGQTNNLSLTSKYFTYQAAGSSNSLSNLDLNAILADFDNPYLDQVDLML